MNLKSDRVILFDIDYTIFDTDKFKNSNLTSYGLYTDVKHTLEDLFKKYKLGILSTGERQFQLRKLKETGIYDLFDKDLVLIFEDKAAEFENLSAKLRNLNVWYVEDKINMLELAKRASPNLKTIWFKNGPYVELISSNFVPDKIINSFSKLKTLLGE